MKIRVEASYRVLQILNTFYIYEFYTYCDYVNSPVVTFIAGSQISLYGSEVENNKCTQRDPTLFYLLLSFWVFSKRQGLFTSGQVALMLWPMNIYRMPPSCSLM